MYRKKENSKGIPDRLYRTPAEIKSDIKEIKEEISDIYSMINIRSLLMDILVSERINDPQKLIPELADTLALANEALSQLKELEDELYELKEELAEAKWARGG